MIMQLGLDTYSCQFGDNIKRIPGFPFRIANRGPGA